MLRPSQQLLRSPWHHLLLRHLLLPLCHWLCRHPNLASALRHPSPSRHRNGLQGIYCPHLCRRKLPSCHSRWIGHELANVDCFRYLPRLLRQFGRLQCWSRRMASTTGLCHDSRTPPSRRCLLLPRITPLVHQEGPLLQCFPLTVPSSKYAPPGCP